ncbi:MAG: hypothetical protein R2932_19735 [Caldilineaceae bacterium]
MAQISEQLRPVWMTDTNRFGLEQRVDNGDEGSCSILSEEGLFATWSLSAALAALARETIEQILRDQGRTAEDIYADMESAAAPLVSLAEVRQIPSAHRLLVPATESEHFLQ